MPWSLDDQMNEKGPCSPLYRWGEQGYMGTLGRWRPTSLSKYYSGGSLYLRLVLKLSRLVYKAYEYKAWYILSIIQIRVASSTLWPRVWQALTISMRLQILFVTLQNVNTYLSSYPDGYTDIWMYGYMDIWIRTTLGEKWARHWTNSAKDDVKRNPYSRANQNPKVEK